MNIASVFQSIRRNVSNHGMLPAGYDVALRSLNRVLYWKTLQFLVTDEVSPQYVALPPNLRCVQLGERQLLAFAEVGEYELGMDFVDCTLQKGDQCYAILDGNTLANYCFFSRHPTLLDNNELVLRFDPHYIYMYKGFTLDRYRGRRLHAISKTRALLEYKELGFKGMLSYVETTNFNSLKSCYRMGSRNCGRARIARIAGRYMIRMESESAHYGLALQVKQSLTQNSFLPIVHSSSGK